MICCGYPRPQICLLCFCFLHGLMFDHGIENFQFLSTLAWLGMAALNPYHTHHLSYPSSHPRPLHPFLSSSHGHTWRHLSYPSPRARLVSWINGGIGAPPLSRSTPLHHQGSISKIPLISLFIVFIIIRTGSAST